VQKLPGFGEKTKAKRFANAYRHKSHDRELPSPFGEGQGERKKHEALRSIITLQLSGKRAPLSIWREPVPKIGRSGERSK